MVALATLDAEHEVLGGLKVVARCAGDDLAVLGLVLDLEQRAGVVAAQRGSLHEERKGPARRQAGIVEALVTLLARAQRLQTAADGGAGLWRRVERESGVDCV